MTDSMESDWKAFWDCLEEEWAEQFKKVNYYDPMMPCDCGSSTCDECNPGWDQESLDDEETTEGEFF